MIHRKHPIQLEMQKNDQTTELHIAHHSPQSLVETLHSSLVSLSHLLCEPRFLVQVVAAEGLPFRSTTPALATRMTPCHSFQLFWEGIQVLWLDCLDMLPECPGLIGKRLSTLLAPACRMVPAGGVRRLASSPWGSFQLYPCILRLWSIHVKCQLHNLKILRRRSSNLSRWTWSKVGGATGTTARCQVVGSKVAKWAAQPGNFHEFPHSKYIVVSVCHYKNIKPSTIRILGFVLQLDQPIINIDSLDIHPIPHHFWILLVSKKHIESSISHTSNPCSSWVVPRSDPLATRHPLHPSAPGINDDRWKPHG